MNPSNAPTPVTLSNGSVVLVSPLTAKDMVTIFNLVRQKELTRMLSAIPKDVDVETRKLMIKLAYEDSRDFNVDESAQFWADSDVQRQAFYMALSKETKDMTYAKVDNILKNHSDQSAILSVMNRGLTEELDEENPDDSKPDNEQKKTV